MGTIQLRQTKRRMIWQFLFVLSFCFAFTGLVAAQQDQGAINGVVKDTKGALVRGAMVTLTNIDTNLTQHYKTDANGEYFFSPIKIGHYSVSATAPWFADHNPGKCHRQYSGRLECSSHIKAGHANGDRDCNHRASHAAERERFCGSGHDHCKPSTTRLSKDATGSTWRS